MLAVYDINAFGVVRVTHAMLPPLERSAAPMVVNVSSGMESLGVTTVYSRAKPACRKS